jgi:branched-chain amino acid transport system substrate-binding protein
MRRSSRWLALLLVFSLIAVACGGDDEGDDAGGSTTEDDEGSEDNGGATDVGVTADEVRVAIVSEQTGSANATSNGVGFTEGFEAHIEKINDEGGINGRNIVLSAAHDDAGDANKNQALIQQAFEQEKVFTVVGCFSKFGAVDFINTNKLPMIGCAHDPPTWEKTDYAFGIGGNWLDTTPNDDPPPQVTAGVAYAMEKLGKKKLAVFSYNHPGSKSASENVCKWAEANFGHDCVYEDYTLAFGFTDLGASLQKLEDSGADFVYGGMDSGGALTIIRSLKRAGLDLPSMWAVLPSQEQAAQSSDLIGQLYGSQAYPPFDGDNPEMEELVSNVEARKPGTKMSFPVVQGWAAAALLAEGLEKAGPQLTRDGFYKAIRGTKAFDSGVGGVVDFTKSPEDKVREGIKPDPSLCAGYMMVGVEADKKMVQVGEKPKLCLAGIETAAALKDKVAKDKSSMKP